MSEDGGSPGRGDLSRGHVCREGQQPGISERGMCLGVRSRAGGITQAPAMGASLGILRNQRTQATMGRLGPRLQASLAASRHGCAIAKSS